MKHFSPSWSSGGKVPKSSKCGHMRLGKATPSSQTRGTFKERVYPGNISSTKYHVLQHLHCLLMRTLKLRSWNLLKYTTMCNGMTFCCNYSRLDVLIFFYFLLFLKIIQNKVHKIWTQMPYFFRNRNSLSLQDFQQKLLPTSRWSAFSYLIY